MTEFSRPQPLVDQIQTSNPTCITPLQIRGAQEQVNLLHTAQAMMLSTQALH